MLPRSPRTLLLVLALVVGGASPVPAARRKRRMSPQRQMALWKKAYFAGAEYSKKGDQARSIRALMKSLQYASGPPRIVEASVRTLRALGKEYARAGQPEKQARALERLLALEEARKTPPGERRPILQKLAELAREGKASAPRSDYLEKLLDLRPRDGGDDPAGLASLLQDLLAQQGVEPARKLNWRRRLLELQQGPLASPPEEVDASRLALARDEAGAGFHGNADRLLLKLCLTAYQIAETDVAEASERLRKIAAAQEDFENLAARDRRLKEVEALGGTDAQRAAAAEELMVQGEVREELRQWDAAADYFRAALMPVWKVRGEVVALRLKKIMEFADTVRGYDRHELFATLLDELLRRAPGAVDPGHPILGRLRRRKGQSLKARGDWAGALEQFRQARDILTKAPQVRDFERQDVRKDLVEAMYQSGDDSGASQEYEDLLVELSEKYGDDSMQVIVPHQRLGLIYMRQGDVQRAEEHLMAAYEIQEVRKSYGRGAKAETNLALAELFMGQGRYGEADHHLSRANYYGAKREDLDRIRGIR